MRFTNPSALLAAVIALTTAPFASGLGINCNGSFLCGNTFCSGGLVGLRNSLQTAINNGRGGDFFGSGRKSPIPILFFPLPLPLPLPLTDRYRS